MDTKSGFGLNTILLILVFIALLVLIIGGFGLASTLRQLTNPLTEAQQEFERQVEEITNPTPTVIPDPITIVHEISSLSRLETASYTIEKVITAESGQGPFAFLFGDQLILVAHGQVIAGVDLSKMQADDIVVAEDGKVFVTLPPAEVLVVALDNQKSYIFDRDTGLIGMNPALETEARRAAEQAILDAALEDGILDMAQRNAETYIRQLIIALGFREVIFTAPSPTPTPAN
ncbi:MAG TPA: DUF4230 domain-containing protein [Anaerolineae bacterium]|nr:DUF4230 domain-containing protein [Anaerolineae bacterium]